MENEIKEIIYIAISAIILSAVLGLVSIMMNVNRDMAGVRNREVQGSRQVMEYRQFNKYGHNTINGDELIECITSLYDSGIEILVKTGVYNLTSTRYTEQANGEEYANAINNSSDFIRYRSVDLTAGRESKYDIDRLMDNFPTNRGYRGYLVFNSQKPGLKFNDIHDGVLNISNLEQELDRVSGFNDLANSEVTGILFIRVE